MGYYTLATGRNRKLEYHIVVGIRQLRLPQKVYFLQMGLAGQISEAKRILRFLARRQVFRPGERILPFGVKTDRQAGLELR
ncbi:MAG TPA: hypothetical protein VGM76_02805 [Lacipirellulaceae bacterium]